MYGHIDSCKCFTNRCSGGSEGAERGALSEEAAMAVLSQLQTSLRAKMQVQKRVAEELRKRSAELTEVRSI